MESHTTQIQKRLLDWFSNNGRHLPWREKSISEVLSWNADSQSVMDRSPNQYFTSSQIRDPYIVVVSEFMLQQTQVDRVIPNKIYQGQALGKVVLTADAPVTRSIFTHRKNMYFCKPSDPEDLVKAIVDLQTHPELRKEIADNGYALYKKEFTPKAVGRKLIQFVQEIL